MADQTVTFTPAEQAALRGEGNPYPEMKVEETTDVPGTDKPDAADGAAGPGKADEAGDKPAESVEADGGDEEVTEVADGTNPDGAPKRKVIAFSAYDKQRHRANKLAEELAKHKEQVAYLSGLSQNAAKAPQTPPAEQTQELSLTPPDKAKEPEKYLAWLETGLSSALGKLKQQEEQTQQTSQFQQINRAVLDAEQEFISGNEASGVEAHPDFADAVKFLQDRHRAELKTAGYDQNEIHQIMTARAQSVAAKALQAGKSPAERVYELAKLAGYKKAAPVKQESEAEKIARQAENQKKAGKTISALPGGESKGGLTAETLANMNPVEFQKLWESGEAQKVMGWAT